ncbi:MAG TPA: hypothetical protein VFH75_03765 [Actinomycetota bacterium]|nr:hypothetical protein [Actinomycetota bacterium]
MQEPEGTFQAGRRYVLGQGEDFYGIWDRELPGKPVETFDLTEVGLQEARRRIARLSSQDFWARIGPKALRSALFGGLALWILIGLVLSISDPIDSPFSAGPVGRIAPLTLTDPFNSGWVKAAHVVEILAFRVWIAALVILVALRLFDRGRQSA